LECGPPGKTTRGSFHKWKNQQLSYQFLTVAWTRSVDVDLLAKVAFRRSESDVDSKSQNAQCELYKNIFRLKKFLTAGGCCKTFSGDDERVTCFKIWTVAPGPFRTSGPQL